MDGKGYLPYNLSSLLPSDSTIAALRELPPPLPNAPDSGFSQDVPVDKPELNNEVLQSMASILSKAAEQSGRSLGDDVLDGNETRLRDEDPAVLKALCKAHPEVLQSRKRRTVKPKKRPRSEGHLNHTKGLESEDEIYRVATANSVNRKTLTNGQIEFEAEVQNDEEIAGDEHTNDNEDGQAFENGGMLASQDDDEKIKAQRKAHADSIEAFTESLENCCVALEEERRDSANSFSNSLILEFCHSIQVHCEMGLSSFVSDSLLLRVLESLEGTIRISARRVEEVDSRAVPQDYRNMSFIGIQCTLAALYLMTAPDAKSNILLEDTLEAMMVLLREVCARLIFPFFDPLYIIPPRSADDGSGSRENGHASPIGSPEDADYDDDTAFVDIQRSSSTRTKKVRGIRANRQTRVEDILRLICFSFDRLSILISGKACLSDTLVGKTTALAALPMNVADVSSMQISAYGVTCAVFHRYSQHRDLIIDRVREQISKIPAKRRNMRTFQLTESKKSVRIASALLVQLVQIAGGSFNEDLSEGENGLSGMTCLGQDEVDDLHEQATIIAHNVIGHVLACSLREKDADYRFALLSLFQDLSEMYTMPEWPAAEVLLRVLFVHLLKRIQKSPEASKGDVFARGFAYELFGSLAARMRRSSKVGTILDGSDKAMRYCAVVLVYLEEQYRLNKSVMAKYAMRFWQIQTQREWYQTQLKVKKEAEKWRIEDREEREPGQDIKKIDKNKTAHLQNLINEVRSNGADRELAKVGSANLHLIRDFATRGYQSILEAIVRGLNETAPTLRTKAIKALAAVHEEDPQVIQSVPMLQQAVRHSCMDVSTIVRDAALDLLSGSFHSAPSCSLESSSFESKGEKCVATGIEKYGSTFFKAVYPVVTRRLLDTATSVRKRALKIMQSVVEDIASQTFCTNGPSLQNSLEYSEDSSRESLVIDVCSKIISRMDDTESSVRDLTRKILALALFDYRQPQKKSKSEANESQLVPVLSSRLVGVCTRLPPASHKRFVSRVLEFGLLEKVRDKLLAMSSYIVCELQNVETEVAELSNSKESPERLELLAKRQVSCASVLAALADADSSLIASHCVALAPSIKMVSQAPTTADVLSTQSILFILESGLPNMKTVSKSYINDVLRDLENLVCQHPSSIIGHAAVRCLSVYDKYAGASSEGSCGRLISLFHSFLDSQKTLIPEFASNDRKGIQNTRVALVRLGLLNRYAEVTEKVSSESFAVLLHYCRETMKGWLSANATYNGHNTGASVSHPFREESLRGLTHLLIRHLRFLPLCTPVLCASLSQGGDDKRDKKTDYAAQLRVITDFQELLAHEEERNYKRSQESSEEVEPKKSKDLAAEDDAEAGYLAGFAQTLLPDLLSAAVSPDRRIRSRIASVLGLLVRQGLVLPAAIVPTLFGLMVDFEEVQTRTNSLRVVTFIAERYPHMLASGTIQGIELAYKVGYQASNSASCLLTNSIDKQTGLSVLAPIISLVARSKRRSTVEYMIKQFDPHITLLHTHSEGISDGKSPQASSHSCDKDFFKEATREKTIKIQENSYVKTKASIPSPIRLGFQASVLATMEYGSTGKVKGSGTTSLGGTAASEQALKRAHEEIGDAICTCSRIISGSGQVLYEILRSIGKQNTTLASDERIHLVQVSVALTMALLVKRYLKFTRTNGETEKARSVDEGEFISSVARIPPFDIPPFLLQSLKLGDSADSKVGCEVGSEQLEYFMKLMKEDALDNREYEHGGDRSALRKRRRSRKSGVDASPRKRVPQSPARSMDSSRSPRYRSFKKTTSAFDDRGDDPTDADFVPD